MSATPPQTEKPFHYTYLKEFRVNQCPLFLQHKCTQHRPFTCFNWHFSNQRRRRPLRKRDGTFNYSADSYCSKYDETTGICPDGDDCIYLHRNTGDTERRYHLRYYKTGTCIHETDSKGNCVKNGPHCAFAHGSNDLRPPVYDCREQQSQDSTTSTTTSEQQKQEMMNLAEKIVNEDPKWQDANFVLGNYKTELCKRPPRLCRQGYACPQYHNTKDKRRNPKKFKYRSSPCPTVKQGDEWKDPTCCEKGDNCQFCHTRTEQQFHPEIYKSTKCHDMTQTGYCPRGPFCAFAHVEQEIRVVEDMPNSPTLPIGSFGQVAAESGLANVPEIAEPKTIGNNAAENVIPKQNTALSNSLAWANFTANINQEVSDVTHNLAKASFGIDNNIVSPPAPSPLLKQVGSSKSLAGSVPYSKAPGSERSGSSDQGLLNTSTFGSVSSNNAWPSLTLSQGVPGIGSYSSTSSSPSNILPRHINSLNSDAAPFYPADETVDSVVGSALKDLDEHNENASSVIGSSFTERRLDNSNGDKSITSSIWAHARSSSHDNSLTSLFPMSDPVNIPQEQTIRENIQRSLRSGISSLSSPVLGGMDFPSAGSLPAGRYFPNYQPSLVGSVGGQTGLSSSIGSGNISLTDVERMQLKCKQWEESWNQAKAACDAWKREATDANERARLSEERYVMVKERCMLLESKLSVNASGDGEKKCQFLHQEYDIDDLRKFPVSSLKQLQTRYKADLEVLEKLIWETLWKPQQKP